MISLLVIFAFSATAIQAEDIPLGEVFGVCPPEDGPNPVYLLDTKNRHVFYECSNGEPTLQLCSGDLVFNPKKNICDYPMRGGEAYGPVGVCPRETGTFPVFLRDGMDITVLYVCMDGKPLKHNCAKGLMYEPFTEECIPML